MTVIYELEQMWKDAVATHLKVILLVHIWSAGIGEHFGNAPSGQSSYLSRFTSVTARMLCEPCCSVWPSQLTFLYNLYLGLFFITFAALSGEGK